MYSYYVNSLQVPSSVNILTIVDGTSATVELREYTKEEAEIKSLQYINPGATIAITLYTKMNGVDWIEYTSTTTTETSPKHKKVDINLPVKYPVKFVVTTTSGTEVEVPFYFNIVYAELN